MRSTSKRRKNPMPTSGAIFLTNGRRRRNGKRRASPHGRLVARFNGRRRNGLAVRSNGKRRNGKRRTRRNGLAVRSNGKRRTRRNGLAVRRNGKRRTRRNGIAVRSNGKRRRNGLAVRRNGRRMFRRRRNTGVAVSALFRPVQKLLAMIPGGRKIAPYVAPAAYGALGLLGVHLALRYGARYIPAQIRNYVTPFGYTLGGIILGTLVHFLPVGSAADKKALSAAMVVGGAGVDVFRKLTGSSALGDEFGDMGDGGLWQLGDDGGMGDVSLYGDPDLGAIRGDYSDAELSDAYYSGADLDSVEGEAALAGPRAWRAKFKKEHRAAGAKGKCSRHAGKHGHRWGWLCKLIGFEKFRGVVALPAAQRTAYIAALRKHAIETLPGSGSMSGGKSISDGGEGDTGLADLGATMYAGAAGAAY